MKSQNIPVVIASAVLALVGAFLLITKAQDSSTIQTQSTIIATLTTDNTALREQVQDLGEHPVAPPAEERVDDATQIPGATGPQGPAGPQGPRGLDGRDGQDGQDGKPGADGAPGTNGTNGTDGAAGANGADGAPGPQGPAGADGQPPVSWSFEWLGITYQCNRTDPFDPAVPTYTCAIP